MELPRAEAIYLGMPDTCRKRSPLFRALLVSARGRLAPADTELQWIFGLLLGGSS